MIIYVADTEKEQPVLPIYRRTDLEDMFDDLLPKNEIKGIESSELIELYRSNDLKSKLEFIDKIYNCYPDKTQYNLYDIAINEYNELIVLTNEPEPTLKGIKPQKQPLTFAGLFKPEYIVQIDKFYNRLVANGLIDTNHIWREAENKNEPAKVYFWLLEKGVLKFNKPTPALICFCKEFGITAYKDNEPTPAPDIRAVTVKNLLNTKLTKEEKKHYENVFSPILIK